MMMMILGYSKQFRTVKKKLTLTTQTFIFFIYIHTYRKYENLSILKREKGYARKTRL